MALVLMVIFALLFGLACVGLMIAMGVYVYRDAQRRGMKAALWTLLALVVPYFIGLVIYLIVRNDKDPLNCPKCGKVVSADFTVCPKCGYAKDPMCPTCGKHIEEGWNICPNCADPLPESVKLEKKAKPKKDPSLKAIIALVIVLPILLASMIASMFAFVYDSDAVTSIDSILASSYSDSEY